MTTTGDLSIVLAALGIAASGLGWRPAAAMHPTAVPRAPQAQEQVSVPFTDASTPGTLIVKLVHGSISVRGTSRKDVLVVPHTRARATQSTPRADGLRRISQAAGFRVEELGNRMTIGSSNPNHSIDFEIEAPVRTHLKLTAINGGDIVVDGIDGELEIQNTNGSIRLNGVSGSVVANTTNGNVVATLTRVTNLKPMAFTSLNGIVDVTLPSTTRANLELRSDRGDVYTDFAIELKPTALPTIADGRRDRGRYCINPTRSISGSINGGGPEFQLRTFNSNVYVRKSPERAP